MSKRNQKVTGQRKKRKKPKSKPGIVAEQAQNQARATGLSEALIETAGDGAISDHATRLTDSRFLTAQRQAMAAQIGRTGGNQYLHSVVTQMKRNRQVHLKVAGHEEKQPRLLQRQKGETSNSDNGGDGGVSAATEPAQTDESPNAGEIPRAIGVPVNAHTRYLLNESPYTLLISITQLILKCDRKTAVAVVDEHEIYYVDVKNIQKYFAAHEDDEGAVFTLTLAHGVRLAFAQAKARLGAGDRILTSEDALDEHAIQPLENGWSPPKLGPADFSNVLYRYHGSGEERARLHEHNLGVIKEYFQSYNGYLADYRRRISDKEKVKTEADLRKIGPPEPPRRFPLEFLNASKDEHKELLLAYDPDTYKTWLEISNRINNLRGKIPPGTIFARAKFYGTKKQGIYKVDFETNLDVGDNGYVKTGKKVTASVELESPIGAVGTSIDTEGTQSNQVSVKAGKKGGIEYKVERDKLGREKAVLKIEAKGKGIEIASDGEVKVTVGGPAAAEVMVNPGQGLMMGGLKFETEDEAGNKIGLYVGIGLQGLAADTALTAIVGQGFFESDPAAYEQMSWAELGQRRFESGFGMAVPYYTAAGAYTGLGFDATMWEKFLTDKTKLEHHGAAMAKFWSELNNQEKTAAIMLGYWDGPWDVRASKLQQLRRVKEAELPDTAKTGQKEPFADKTGDAPASIPQAGAEPETPDGLVPDEVRDEEQEEVRAPDKLDKRTVNPRHYFYWARDNQPELYRDINKAVDEILFEWMQEMGQRPRKLTARDVRQKTQAYLAWQLIRDQFVQKLVTKGTADYVLIGIYDNDTDTTKAKSP